VSEPGRTGRSGSLLRGPYRRLRAFEESDREYFLARDDAITEVLRRLSDTGSGIVVVSGVSGTGKSSLLRAGMLPRLRSNGLAGAPEARSWPCLLFTPGTAPLDELAAQVAALAGSDVAGARRSLAAAPERFGLLARRAVLARARRLAERAGRGAPVASRQRLLLVIDQFEQLFTRCPDESERRAFITALHSAAVPPDDVAPDEAPALVVLGVRADLEARCTEYPQLTAAILWGSEMRFGVPCGQLGSYVVLVGESAEDLFPVHPVLGEVDRLGRAGRCLSWGQLAE
jgi:hypothetical protein